MMTEHEKQDALKKFLKALGMKEPTGKQAIDWAKLLALFQTLLPILLNLFSDKGEISTPVGQGG